VSQTQGDILHLCSSCSLLNRSQLLLGFSDCLYDAKNEWHLLYRRQSWNDLILLLSQHCNWSVRLISQVLTVSIVTVSSSTRPGGGVLVKGLLGGKLSTPLLNPYRLPPCSNHTPWEWRHSAPETYADLNSLTTRPLAQELDAFCRSEGLKIHKICYAFGKWNSFQY